MSQTLGLPRRLSWPLVTVLAALETLALRLYGRDAAATTNLKLSSLVLSFGLFWLANLAVCGLYFTFIYPFYPEDGIGSWATFPYSIAPLQANAQGHDHDGLLRFFMLFNQERLLAISPKAVAEITVTNSYVWEKPGVVRDALSTVTGVGLVTSEGDEHRRQRRHMLPAFNFRHIKDLYPVFWDKSREVAQAMTKSVHGREGQLHVSHWASLATLDIIGMAAMGRDFSAIRDPENPLVAQYTNVFEGQSLLRVFLVLGLVLPQWLIEELPIKRIRQFRDAMRAIRSVCQDLIEEKRAKLQAQKQDKTAQPDVDILSIALESGQFTDVGLQNQLMTFFAAGHETTSVSLTWAIYALCLKPAMQTRLRAEVRAHLPSVDDAGAALTSVDFDRLPYLNAVVNETLRRYPSVPVTGRVAMQDTSVLGVPVARGTSVTIPQWAINVDKTLWGDDAEDFNPDRWLDARTSDDGGVTLNNTGGSNSNYALATFLHGPRSCIGAAFAKGEFACLLAALVGRFEFELVDKTLMDPDKLKVKGGVTIKPADGLHVIARVVPGY
ncbi:Protein LUTEIN DEFICIENT 5, chloroplastic [Beauveria bassiana]|uniref:Protein LUTEIN DEFICIENT 5, chloroplastic n=1 Tax=Beauveria bassiana TaxID=176275 RepID=A0A2N6N9Z7_BEABA|nr:Protein LUTEIN DEFICIENT 5, chloroplastic [Beauveria bassiana]